MNLEETRQSTNAVLMIRPAHFGYNPQTAANNAFQQNDPTRSATEIAEKARKEFDLMAESLSNHGVEVLVVEDDPNVPCTDAVFPNNWISMHEDGTVITYPMFSEIRRRERREDVIAQLGARYHIADRLRLEWHEAEDRFLEGTGSLVLDRVHHVAYACHSVRTHPELLEDFCTFAGYERVSFTAVDKSGHPIYHTNVMMAVGDSFAVVALDALVYPEERAMLLAHLEHSGKAVVEISLEQMQSFAGNMLALRDSEGRPLLVMSATALRSLTDVQKAQLAAHATLLAFEIPTIETFGGGSVRCMLAEIFLPRRS